MTARGYARHLICTLLAATLLLALPAAALAGTGGAGGLTGGASPVATTVPTQSAGATVSTSGDGVTLQTTASAMLRRGLSFSGTAVGAAGKTIEIQRSGQATDWEWTPTAQTTVDSDGSFATVWRADTAGQFAVRAIVVSQLASAASATPSLTVTVYRTSRATLYGPGFYGRRTACGARLSRAMIGVANRTLRCGTSVSIDYAGRTLVVPVIDRGPYANGADWDLTMATGRALGMDGTAQIGAVAVSATHASTAGRTKTAATVVPGAQALRPRR